VQDSAVQLGIRLHARLQTVPTLSDYFA